MTQHDRNNTPQKDSADQRPRRAWTRPVLTAYGPIGKLTQGGTGAKNDASSTKKA